MTTEIGPEIEYVAEEDDEGEEEEEEEEDLNRDQDYENEGRANVAEVSSVVFMLQCMNRY